MDSKHFIMSLTVNGRVKYGVNLGMNLNKIAILLTKPKLNLPPGQSLFIWYNGESVTPILAKDLDEAYRKVIANRLKFVEGDTDEDKLEEAIRWFERNDQLFEVNTEPLTDAPYVGELPELPT